ncbi:MAG: phosphatase PAP2 family protein [Alphaproteobacteria bacterium]|nr:phosphatase PAP2 family protein [Alphaproteobacteria bacterium]
MKLYRLSALSALLLAVACSVSPAPVRDPAAAPVEGAAASLRGFLTPATTPDASAIIPPAPIRGGARDAADREIFEVTRTLADTPRWVMAASDDSYRPADVLGNYACSLGVSLTPQSAPVLSAVLTRAAIDSGAAAVTAKEVYKRPRPYVETGERICITRSVGLDRSYDYPSGHASLGWIQGLILAQLAPERSTGILARARAYGESRLVCGVHNASAVEAGRTNASAVFAAIQASDEFRDMMAKAKAELDAAELSGPKPDPETCAREADLVRARSFSRDGG